jgi:hypothetical protein
VPVPAVAPKEAPDAATRLAEVSAALAKVSSSLRRPRAAEDVLRKFAESPMVYEPPPNPPWIHEDLGKELPDQPQLG